MEALTTGRHPLVAGLIALTAEVNVVTDVSVEDIAQDISAVMHTRSRRYKELVDALVHVVRKLLSWGADVNAKKLLLYFPVLLRLMEMWSHLDPSEQFLESFAPDMSGIVQAYSSVDNDESKYLHIVSLDDLDFNNFRQQGKESEGLKISEECLSDIYQNVLKKLSEVKELGKFGKGAIKRKRWGRGLELDHGQIKDVPLEISSNSSASKGRRRLGLRTTGGYHLLNIP